MGSDPVQLLRGPWPLLLALQHVEVESERSTIEAIMFSTILDVAFGDFENTFGWRKGR